MTDPNAANELVKQVMDVYRVFSIELQALQLKKTELIKAIIARVDREKTDEVQKTITQMSYERNSPQA